MTCTASPIPSESLSPQRTRHLLQLTSLLQHHTHLESTTTHGMPLKSVDSPFGRNLTAARCYPTRCIARLGEVTSHSTAHTACKAGTAQKIMERISMAERLVPVRCAATSSTAVVCAQPTHLLFPQASLDSDSEHPEECGVAVSPKGATSLKPWWSQDFGCESLPKRERPRAVRPFAH